MAKCKLTPEVQARICDGIRLGMTYKLAAEYGGVHEASFYNWIKQATDEDEGIFFEFFKAVTQAKTEAVATNLGYIQEAAEAGEWKAATWILERRHPDDYMKRQEQRVTGVDGADIFKGWTTDELRKAAKNVVDSDADE